MVPGGLSGGSEGTEIRVGVVSAPARTLTLSKAEKLAFVRKGTGLKTTWIHQA